MYKNHASGGKLNISGIRIAHLRMSMHPRTSQRMLADQLQLAGLDLDKNAISKIELGKRFVTDIELKVIADFFGVTTDSLLITKESTYTSNDST